MTGVAAFVGAWAAAPVHWAEALVAGSVGAAGLAAARLRRLVPGAAVYIPFYMICRGWWRADTRPVLAICTLLSVMLVLPAVRRVSVPRPVLWSVLGIMLAAGVSLAFGVALDVDTTGVLQAAAVTGVGFGAYLVATTVGADLRGRLGLVGAVALLLLLGATSWHARIVVAALRRPEPPPDVLSRVRTLNDRLRLPGLTLRAGQAEVRRWLEAGAVEKARTVSDDLVRIYPTESGPAVLHARVLRRLGDPAALTWVASAAGGPLSDEDRTYVARELMRAGWVGPWAATWQSMGIAGGELFADSSYAFRLAVALRLQGRPEEARRLLDLIRGGVPESRRAYELGRVAEDCHESGEARTWYARSCRAHAPPPDACRRSRGEERTADGGAVVGDVVGLRSWSVWPETVSSGESVRVVLVLEVLEFPPEDYRVFLHFEESLHPRHRFQGDHDPLQDLRSSTSWLPGETVADTTWVRVPCGTPAGRYRVWTGLFVPLGSKPRLGGEDRGRISVGWLNVIG